MSLDLAARVVRAQGRIALADAAARIAAWQRSQAEARVERAEVEITEVLEAADEAVRAAREDGDPDWRQAGRAHRVRLQNALERKVRALADVERAEAKAEKVDEARRIAQRERDELREQLARAFDREQRRRERRAR